MKNPRLLDRIIGISTLVAITICITACAVSKAASSGTDLNDTPIDLELVINTMNSGDLNAGFHFLNICLPVQADMTSFQRSRTNLVVIYHCKTRQLAEEIIESLNNSNMLVGYRTITANK